MRPIGHLTTETSARTFADFLYVQGIENEVDHESADGWAIWVADEDKLERATELLNAFKQNPNDPKYRTQAKNAAELRTAEAKEDAAYQKKVRTRRQLFAPMQAYGFGPLTFALIVVCVVVAILSKLGDDPERVHGLFMSEYLHGLPEIKHGQVWRLLTPIFLHFNVLHLLFDMWVLRDFGSMVEARQGSWHLAVLVVVIGVLSNLAQVFSPGASPFFGGMSGVDYGLFGYIWIRGKYDPGSGLFLHQNTVVMMLIWFFACLFHIIPHVANGAHAGGLVVGMAWGYLSSLRRS